MADFPFDDNIAGIRNGDDAELADVALSQITFPDGSTQTQAATPSSKVTDLEYAGTTLTLKQSSGIGDLTTTIDATPEVRAFNVKTDSPITQYMSNENIPYDTTEIKVPSTLSWNNKEFTASADDAGQWLFSFTMPSDRVTGNSYDNMILHIRQVNSSGTLIRNIASNVVINEYVPGSMMKTYNATGVATLSTGDKVSVYVDGNFGRSPSVDANSEANFCGMKIG